MHEAMEHRMKCPTFLRISRSNMGVKYKNIGEDEAKIPNTKNVIPFESGQKRREN